MVPRILRPRARRPRTARDALTAAALACAPWAAACSSVEPAAEAPPLATMEEPLALMAEPADEAERRELAAGAFTGVYVTDARRSLDAMLGEAPGVLVERVVENSPGVAAGLQPDDLIFEVEAPAPGGGRRTVEVRWPSEWRGAELASAEGDELVVRFERAGVELEARLLAQRRLQPAERLAGERLREELRVGVVLRTATEVEARAAGLAPGAGAVVVGLSQDSPWRKAGVRFEDLILAVDGEQLAHPAALVTAIRDAPAQGVLTLQLLRADERLQLEAPVSRRATELKQIHVPLLFRYERRREASETSVLFGLFGLERTSAAWQVRLLWFITFGGGDADRLIEVDA